MNCSWSPAPLLRAVPGQRSWDTPVTGAADIHFVRFVVIPAAAFGILPCGDTACYWTGRFYLPWLRATLPCRFLGSASYLRFVLAGDNFPMSPPFRLSAVHDSVLLFRVIFFGFYRTWIWGQLSVARRARTRGLAGVLDDAGRRA